jgi:RNA polymerase sigma factor (sigma-70 family)
MTETTQLLAEYVGAGSEAAFGELVRRYINLVHSTALRLVGGDRCMAEDVTQTVFADLARAAPTFSKDAKLGGWLHRHVCFVAAKTMRGERRRRVRERQAVEMNATQGHTAAPAALVAQEIDEAINHLREADRTAILLRFFEQRDFRSVGLGLGISEEAARKRVTRALEKLHIRLTRRGVVLPVTALGAVLAGEAVTSAPAGLAAGVATSAIAAAATGGTLATLNFMAMTNIKPVFLSVAALAAVTTPLVVQHRSEMNLRRENQDLRQQLDGLAQLQAENALLSNQLAQVRQQPPPQDEHRELLRLRGEVGLLRDQSNQAVKLRAEVSRMRSQIAAGSTSPIRLPPKSNEPADISYNFPGIPVSQLFDFYENLCGKKLVVKPSVLFQQTVRIMTEHPITRSEAKQLIEDSLKEQANLTIVTADDGSLSVVPMPAEKQ